MNEIACVSRLDKRLARLLPAEEVLDVRLGVEEALVITGVRELSKRLDVVEELDVPGIAEHEERLGFVVDGVVAGTGAVVWRVEVVEKDV